MDKLILICLIGFVACITLLIKDVVACIKTKLMCKRTINKCFKILQEMEVDNN